MTANLDFNFHDVRRIKIGPIRSLSASRYYESWQLLEIEVFDGDGNCVG